MSRRRNSKRRSGLASLVLMSPAMLDCFAIPLLVIANRQHHNYQSSPISYHESGEPSDDTPKDPFVVKLVGSAVEVDGQPKQLSDLPATFAAKPNRQILVHVRTDESGDGPVNHLLQLSALATRNSFSDRMKFLCRETREQPNAK